jgi:Terpene synthase family 2, C-terminal metal binding
MTASILSDVYAGMACRPSEWAASAEEHVRAWVRAHGLVRSENAMRRFDKTEAGDLAARVYRSAATESALAVAADWIGWLFLIDDQFDEGSAGRSPEAARERILPLLDLFTADCPGPGPAGDVLQSALTDLWLEIKGRMPREWRGRFVRHVREYLNGCAWEAANRAGGIVPGPQEYVPNRRAAGAIWPCLDLLEFATGAPLPEWIHRDLLFSEMCGIAADVVCWTDDLLTVTKERARGDVHNLVIVTEHANGCTADAAAHLVEGLIELRIADFEARERRLTGWFDAVGLDEPMQRRVLLYVDGLRDWMRGHFDWGMKTVRYHEVEQQTGVPSYIEDLLVCADKQPSTTNA